MKNKIPGRNSTGHGGDIYGVLREKGCGDGDLLDFSANITPLGPPEWLRPLVSRVLDEVAYYPDPFATELVAGIAKKYQVDESCVLVGNGSVELLYGILRSVTCKQVRIPVPSYSDYERAARVCGLPCLFHLLNEQNSFQLDCRQFDGEIVAGDLVIIASPNNPNGKVVAADEILWLAERHPEALFLVDEAFLDFCPGAPSVAGQGENIITLHSMTKFYGVPGLRLGFAIAPSAKAQALRDQLPPWNVNTIAQNFAVKALQDSAYCKQNQDEVRRLREQLLAGLEQFATFSVFPADANFLLVKTARFTVPELARRLLAQNILIRCCDNYRGLDEHFFRVAVRTEQENNQLLDALRTIFNKHQRISRPRKCPALMLQGTSSNAGKSVLCAAFCRILLQDGIQVAPFKAQNMSLNSFVTRDGREMGRAQVVQAQAARRDPDVRMNPVLLKPNSDTGSQIIVNGLPVGNMSVFDYSRYKSTVWQDVVASYHSLAAECDAIILEGAGSPGEVNLKKRDIVNMRMARHAEAPVLLVGDIDRGGVYASFVGTMEVLEQWERQLIAGFLVNRFRGQESLLASAHEYLFAHTGKKVFGVIPYLDDLGLPEEDSVSFKEGLFDTVARREDSVDIVLVDLPHISNFTDFESFLGEPDVTFRVVREPAEIGNPDALLLPGSKNVFADLKFLFDRGFAGIFHQKQREEQCEIVAICGGYQMLGREISDPLGIESSSPNMTGLGLLELTTELLAEKKLTRRQGVHLALGQEIAGYEIHHGISLSEGASCLRFNDGTSCGSVSANGLVWGCYLHGIFDNDLFRRSFLDRLRIRKGLEPINEVLVCYDLEAAFDRLAAVVRERVDMNFLYELMNL